MGLRFEYSNLELGGLLRGPRLFGLCGRRHRDVQLLLRSAGRFDGRDMQQTAPDGVLRQVAAVGDGHVDAVAQQECHFGVADFVGVATREPDAEWLEWEAGHEVFEDAILADGGTHIEIVVSAGAGVEDDPARSPSPCPLPKGEGD